MIVAQSSRFCLTAFTLLAAFCLGSTAGSAVAAGATAKLELQKGDHISIIGNTLADRMQHFGWLETLINARLPQHELVIRNLGFSGDELTLRLRSQDFGSPDQHLANNKTDVIFAFFGYNESFAGTSGLDKFKKDLDGSLKQMLAQKYNGKGAPRIVLFSPIGHENLKDANLPDGSENNARLKLYTDAMAQVAEANKVLFVDLLAPSLQLYKAAAKPLTINGVHLNEQGDRLVAGAIDGALFGPPAATDGKQLEKLRQVVLDKNFHWYNRHRTTDGFSIFGGRADLKFVAGQSNRDVAKREMEVLDVMTANRDKLIWAVAQGKDFKVDDSNTPPFIDVVTNKPGPLPGGKHIFLGGEEEISKLTVGKNLKVNLFASEEKFPEVCNPVQMAFDTKGRLWVAAWPSYPHYKPKDEMNDKLLILEDTDGDGKADKCITFADHLHNPTGFEFWGGGVLVAMAPDILFLKDTDGDDKADFRERRLTGLDSADTHHTSNSFTLDPGGALYFQEGTFHHTQVETPWGPTQRLANAGVFRYEPRAQKFDVYVSYGFANPHGHVFDEWGQDIVVDGTGADPYHAALFSGHVEFPQKHNRPPQVYQQRTRPCSGMEYLSSRHFPDDMQGNLLVCNVIGFQGILRYKVNDKGSSYGATEMEPLLSSSDPSFRPADVEVGADGAIYFTDWHNPIIGHMQHNLRDPSRDKTHGRVYRVTYEGRPLSKPAKIAGEPIEKLLELLKEPEARVRYRAKIELSGRDTREVMPALDRWIASLDKKDKLYEHHMLEGLWMHQHHNVVNVELLERMLKSPDFHARAAATRVLCYWRDRVSNALELVKQQAGDQHPRVRLEAIRTASFFPLPEAMEVPVIAAEHPTDIYLDFLRGETTRTLDPYWKKTIAEGRQVAFTSDAGARYMLRNIGTEQLLKMPRSRGVFVEMMYRPGLRDEQRREAVAGLAKLEKKPELRVIMEAIAGLDDKQDAADASVVFDLVRQLTSRNVAELGSARAELEKLATSAKQPVLRQIGFVSLINVDGSTDKAWALAGRSVASLRDFISAMPLISDASLRSSLYPKIEPLLRGLPESLAASAGNGKGTYGRFVRIELPRRGTLTLAEVEVMSDGRNVARSGKATQSTTNGGGEASKAIDGNKNESYNGGGQTHTNENSENPWWEVDLQEEVPVEGIVVYNRGDGGLGSRLEGFTLKVLDKSRSEVFRKDAIPAPKPSAAFELSGGGPVAVIRRAAMNGLTYVRGQEAKTFETLAKFVRDDVDRIAAIRALERIPKSEWKKDQAQPLLDVVLAHVRKVPPQDRTSPEVLDALEFAQALANLLPAEKAKLVRANLNELGVRVIRMGTLLERMSYDKDVVVVKAGKPVEFLFENSDLMPHNFVITQPGAMEEIGKIAEETAQQPGAAERHYVPQSNKILLKSILLQPRAMQKLSFTAPTQPGVYPYVCTYPGHWRRMYGALYVVDDIDAYQENPEAYLTLHPLEVKDALLKDRRPRTEWKLEDLAGAVSALDHGRSYGSGKQIFQVANCIACHKMDNVGTQIGPDLTKLDAKLQSGDILKDILEPSSRINEKFQTFVFELDSGKVITGMILEETPQAVKVIENPLLKAEATVIDPKEIVERKKSTTSIMPKGQLDKLTREEILDLVAYVIARGDKEHALFQGGGHDHEHGDH